MAVAPFPGLLLQFEQTLSASFKLRRAKFKLRRQSWRHVGPAGAVRPLERSRRLALCATRCRWVVALPSFLRLPERAVQPARALPVNAWSLRSGYTSSLGSGLVAAWLVTVR